LERSQIATTLNEKFLKVYKHKVPHKKGVVFIGNSRIGKSTLSVMLKGVEVQVKFSEGDDMLRIEPKCPQLRKN
jgi:energy-coupling factor transporter ATP-binding protein EcfA2